MIRFACPTCKSILEAPDHKAGTKIPCPKCEQRLEIPALAVPSARNKTVLGALVARLVPRRPKPSAPALSEKDLSSQWFYTKDGKSKIGPVCSADLQALASSGQLLPTHMVWKEGMGKWTTASKITGLFANPESTAKASPPPEAIPLNPLPYPATLPSGTRKGFWAQLSVNKGALAATGVVVVGIALIVALVLCHSLIVG